MFRFYSNLQSFRYIIGPGWCRGGGRGGDEGWGLRWETYRMAAFFSTNMMWFNLFCHVTQRDDYLHMYLITEKEVTENFVFWLDIKSHLNAFYSVK